MFERVILTNLVYNEQYARSVLPHLEADYFNAQSDQIVFNLIKDFVAKYNVPPTKEALAIAVSNSNLGEGQYEEVLGVIKELEKDEEPNFKWLVDETEQHCKKQALYNAMSLALDIADGRVKDKDPNGIPSMIMDALAVSFNSSVGHDYWEDAEKHWQNLHSEDARHPFSMAILNKVTKGGIKDKTLNVILAPINGGKSIHLIQQSADWLVRGKNVLYISMEMDEQTVRERIDTVALNMTFDQVYALEKTQYLSRVNEIKRKTQGRLMVKEFPAGSAHVGHFRHLLQELKIKKQFVPDVIMIDYLTICASAKLPSSAKGNTNTYFTSVAEELRAFAQEPDVAVPIWTAVQLDRASQGASDAGLGNVGLAIGVAATADFMFAVLIPEELAAMGRVIGKIIKNRYSSYKGKFLLGLNPDKQQYYEVDQAAGLSEDELTELGLPNNIGSGTEVISRSVTEKADKVTEGWDFN
jgi:archaellum biogenesis ATPase FlaH